MCRVGVCRFVDWSTEAGRGRTWRSSASVHLSLRMLGLTLWRQRCAHCWPVRPGISAATAAHRLPCLACSRGRNVIAQKKFLRCGRCRCVRYGAYLKCGELDVFDVGPWRTLRSRMSAIVIFTRLGWGIRVGRGVCSAEWLGLRVISSVNSDRVRDMGKTRPPFLSQRENVTVWQKNA